MEYPQNFLTKDTLISIVACMAHWGASMHATGAFNEDGTLKPGMHHLSPNFEALSYALACLLANNTPEGQDGVDWDEAMGALQLRTLMDYPQREALAQAWVEQYWPGNASPEARYEAQKEPANSVSANGEGPSGEELWPETRVQEARYEAQKEPANSVSDEAAREALTRSPGGYYIPSEGEFLWKVFVRGASVRLANQRKASQGKAIISADDVPFLLIRAMSANEAERKVREFYRSKGESLTKFGLACKRVAKEGEFMTVPFSPNTTQCHYVVDCPALMVEQYVRASSGTEACLIGRWLHLIPDSIGVLVART